MIRAPFDVDAYAARVRSGPCFICEFLRGNPVYRHHIAYEDASHVVFLNKYPTLEGYCLVAPKSHREDLATDLSPSEYLALQAVVHRLARALKQAFAAERIYVLSLGSKSGNSHVHFHVAPLPAGVTYERQQFHALMAENGLLALSDAKMVDLAAQIGAAYAAISGSA